MEKVKKTIISIVVSIAVGNLAYCVFSCIKKKVKKWMHPEDMDERLAELEEMVNQ